MNRRFLLILLHFFTLSIAAQTEVKVMRQQSLKRYGIPAGNYSGITRIGGNRYAVCDDKGADGFHLWDIDIDEKSGKILDVRDVSFCKSGTANRDAEDIAYVPDLQTVFMASEADSRIYSYALDGTPKSLVSEPLLPGKNHGTGIEALTYDARRKCLWAMQENDGTGHSLLFSFNFSLLTFHSQSYTLDAPSTQKRGMTHVHGISAICATADGHLLVLEREAFVPQKKIGAWCRCKLFSIVPETPSEKRLLATWRTRLNLTARSWANYEGMCLGPRLDDGRQVVILLSDSQNGYGGVLRDRVRTVLLSP